MRSSADFIVDGSTLDNIFDPAMVVRNFADMLRPGGRLITTNVFGNYHEPYVILPPLWFLDYFVTNGFVDCKVYILVLPPEEEPATHLVRSASLTNTDVFTIDLDALLDPNRHVSAFTSPRAMLTMVFAEKGSESTSNISPSQQHYRSNDEWALYRENLRRIRLNPRPHLARTRGHITLTDVKAGHLFMANDFEARDPLIEIRRLPTNDSVPAPDASML